MFSDIADEIYIENLINLWPDLLNQIWVMKMAIDLIVVH